MRLVENLSKEATSKESSATEGAFGVTHVDRAVLSSAGELGLVLYFEVAAEQTRDQKRNATFIGRFFYPHAASLLEELRTRHSTACKKHTLSIDEFLLTKILDEDPLSAGEENVPGHIDSFHLRSGREEEKFCCSRQDPCSARCSCSWRVL